MRIRILSQMTAIALTMMATAVAGCSSSDDNNSGKPLSDGEVVLVKPEPPTSLELTRSEQAMVEAGNSFAFDLFRVVQDPVKSQVLSPISITYALGMLNNGAAGETQQQISQVLGYGDAGADAINDFCYKMLNTAPAFGPQAKVSIANAIYVNHPYVLLPDFVQKTKVYYDAGIESRDFHDGQTMNVINQWAGDHTEGMIKKVLDEDTFDPDAVSYLLNAIYFKGMWAKKFDKSATRLMTFEHAGMTEELTHREMMYQRAMFEYTETDDYQVLRLPYESAEGSSGSLLMTVLLPKQKEGRPVNALPEVPTAETWQQLCQPMDSIEVDLLLPRFDTDTDINLVPVMQELGMRDAFSTEADFRYFCDRATHIDLMKQSAKIKLDEEGTEAAAVTVIGMKYNSVEPQTYVSFHANHPFLYVISERHTGAIFFIGQFTGY